MRLIDADALIEQTETLCSRYEIKWTDNRVMTWIDNAPTIEAEPVVRCKDCVYYHKAHVLCDDGTEKDYSEFPHEAFGVFGQYVTGNYGINVGGKCEIDTNNGYAVDKSVFRSPDDFCSRGKRREEDAVD